VCTESGRDESVDPVRVKRWPSTRGSPHTYRSLILFRITATGRVPRVQLHFMTKHAQQSTDITSRVFSLERRSGPTRLSAANCDIALNSHSICMNRVQQLQRAPAARVSCCACDKFLLFCGRPRLHSVSAATRTLRGGRRPD
jgi:hypothetical protein